MRLHHLSRALVAATLLAAGGCSGSQGTAGMPPAGGLPESAALRTGANPAHAAQYTYTKYLIPTADSEPNRIITGPDGALWFTEEAASGGALGRVDTQGNFTEFSLGSEVEPSHLMSAFGNIWFTEAGHDDIGFMTPAAQFTFYTTPSGSTTRGIVIDPGKGVWFTEFDADKIGVLNAGNGAIKEYAVPTQLAKPYDIVVGPDHALWFTETHASKIGRVTLKGAFTEFRTPGAPQSLVVGPDGALWFTETVASKIGRMTTAGSITEYPTPTAKSEPDVITNGPDGALWFTEYKTSQIGRITVDGTITEAATPDAHALPVGITTGPDQNIWFVEHLTNAIVTFTP
jgi:virginiamycin B lyase